MIFDGAFAPGERLVEATIAQALGISRGPLREAMRTLEQEGIVTGHPRRGKFVTTMDVPAIDELYTFRKALEVFAADLVISAATDEGLERLHASLDAMRIAAASTDPLATARADIAFHGMLYELAEHSLVQRAWRDLIVGKQHILLNRTTRTHADLTDTVRRHEVILTAIESRDTDRAARDISIHIEDARRRAVSDARSADRRRARTRQGRADRPRAGE
jgi:DNA-binding GntR family transcriptional regulator